MVNPPQSETGTFLELLTEELDIPDSLFEKAKSYYEAVGHWLSTDGTYLAQFLPEIYLQGSGALGTITRPIGKDEFDLDLVNHFLKSPTNDPVSLKLLVGNRLKENKKYQNILEEKKRCWRLNYAGDFHMDILPAIPDPGKNGTNILVPDKELSSFVPSNPKGFKDWFIGQMQIRFDEAVKKYRATFRMDEVEPVPNYKIKTPLQRTIQVLKRHRDIYFQHTPNNKPISIILTTLTAHSYNNETDIYEAITNTLDKMPSFIRKFNNIYWIANPVNLEENFADRWNSEPIKKDSFYKWHAKAVNDFQELSNKRGLDEFGAKFNNMFGDAIGNKVFKRYANDISELRSSNLLSMNALGALSTTGIIRVKKNTFHGEQ